MKKIILASNNNGKVREFKKILEPLGIDIISLKEAEIKLDVDETGTTFSENSELKAKALYEISKSAVIADDSGLVIDAFDGAPGVYSSRFAGENATDEEKNKIILEKMKSVADEKRTARFVCDICYIDEKGSVCHAEGKCEGKIGKEPKGSDGFGYDPIFYVSGKSFAELSAAEKNQISHRANALERLREILK